MLVDEDFSSAGRGDLIGRGSLRRNILPILPGFSGLGAPIWYVNRPVYSNQELPEACVKRGGENLPVTERDCPPVKTEVLPARLPR